MNPRSGLRHYALPGIAALAVAASLVGTIRLKAARPVLTMLGVPCPIGNTTVGQASALCVSGLTHLRVVKFAPVRLASDGFVPDATTSEEARQQTHGDRIACEDVEHGCSYPRCRGAETNELGLADPFVSELQLSLGPDGHPIGADVYRRGMSANDTAAAWDDVRHMPRDVLGMPMSTVGNTSPVVLDASPLQIARLQ